jgi:hypothetical protein
MARLNGILAATPDQAGCALAVLHKADRPAKLWSLRLRGTSPRKDGQRYPETARERSWSAAEFAALSPALAQAERQRLPRISQLEANAPA